MNLYYLVTRIALVGLVLSACGDDAVPLGDDGGVLIQPGVKVNCNNSLDCTDAPGDQSICDTSARRCVQCVGDADCEDPLQCVRNSCTTVQQCDNSLDCDLGQVCEVATSRCVECVTEADCEDEEICSADQTCKFGCNSDNDCTAMGQLCDLSLGHCTEPGDNEGAAALKAPEAIDLLFVVDNSQSMVQEQAALRLQFPRLVQALTSGDSDFDGIEDFSPLTDVHLGVVSSDMGLQDVVGVPTCDTIGDDGVLLHRPAPSSSVAGCEPSYPTFLSYDADLDDAALIAHDFACIASLGTDGCGFEQQLEASLKALWPSTGTGVTFLGSNQGHGDGANAGFLRSDPQEGLSLIGVIIVSDEDDCSAHNTRIFTPLQYLPDTDPLKEQPINLRCFLNEDALYDVERYIGGLRNLRRGREELVTFAAIVGVPPDLVSAAARQGVDFSNDTQREAYYDKILNDPRMQNVPDPTGVDTTRNLTPSCNTATGKAYPPRRIVEVARGFGEYGVVQSICPENFSDAIDAVVATIVQQRLRNRK